MPASLPGWPGCHPIESPMLDHDTDTFPMADVAAYQPRRIPEVMTAPVRNLEYRIRVWQPTQQAPEDAVPPPLVLCHGWMDVGASFQFMVDAFSDEFLVGRPIIALDWRGFGETRADEQDNFWFPDYLADLDGLLDVLEMPEPIDLLGHSMGGNVVMQYAGLRPERIRRLINVEGFGQPAAEADEVISRLRRWMDEMSRYHDGRMGLRDYDHLSLVAKRLQKTNPRLSADKAMWLAGEWAEPVMHEDGVQRWRLLGNPANKITTATQYRVDEILALWKSIEAPTLMVKASDQSFERWWQRRYTMEEFDRRLGVVPDLRTHTIPECGHMLHHDQPELLAREIEAFLS